MQEEDVKVSTGIPVIDQLIDGLRWGDNVVWQVTTPLEYRWLVSAFVQDAAKKQIEIIYMHFDSYEIPGISCPPRDLDPPVGPFNRFPDN